MSGRQRRAVPGARLLVTLIVLVLGACGSVPPVPEDVFLRLPPPGAGTTPAPATWTGAAVRVAPLRASGLFKERALVDTDAAGIVLRQHRYLYWQESPEIMLQHALAERLRAARVAPRVVTGPATSAALEVEGRIEAFERIAASAGPEVRVVLELAVQNRTASDPLLRERYEARTTVAAREPAATAAAMGAALDAVVHRFLADAAAAIDRSAQEAQR